MSSDSKRDSPRYHSTEREKFENWLEFTKPEDDWSPLAVWFASAELKGKEIAMLRAELAGSDAALQESRKNDMEAMRQLGIARAELDEYREMKPVAYTTGRTLHWYDGTGVTNAQLFAHPPKEK